MTDRKVLEMRVQGRLHQLPGHPRIEPLTLRRVLKVRPSTPYNIESSSTPQQALQLMQEHDTPALLVTAENRILGYFSEREFARAEARALSLHESFVPCQLSVQIDDPVQHCIDLMRTENLRFIPVLEHSSPIALLSLEDLLSEMVSYLEQVFQAYELDQQIVFLRGTYSC